MQMWPGRPSAHADFANLLSHANAIAGFDQTLALVEVAGRNAMAMVDEGEAPFQIVVASQRDRSIGGC
jgi:hypothetical protein